MSFLIYVTIVSNLIHENTLLKTIWLSNLLYINKMQISNVDYSLPPSLSLSL